MSIKEVTIALVACILYISGFCSAWLLYPHVALKSPAVNVPNTQISTNANISTDTSISYIKKTAGDADIDVLVSPPTINVKLNGLHQSFTVATDESYVFEKNKISMDQRSNVLIDFKVTPKDETKHYGIGAGIGFNGLSGIGTFPVQWIFDGWIYLDKAIGAGGVMVRF